MPLIEVDDATASAMASNGIKYQDRTGHAKTAQTIAERVAALENGPHRAEYLRLLKQQFPDMVVPEIDAAKPVLDEVADLRKMFSEHLESLKTEKSERETRDREEQANKTVSQGRGWLRTKQKLDDDGVKSVESIMQDRGIADYEAAYLVWKAQQPLPAVDLPSNNLGRSLDWFKQEEDQPDKDLLLKDPLAYRAKRGRQILNQIRSGEIDEFGRPTNRAA